MPARATLIYVTKAMINKFTSGIEIILGFNLSYSLTAFFTFHNEVHVDRA
jgi:hypothetical protein